VRLLLHQLGVPFERIEMDLMAGATRTSEFLRRNPNGRIPVLELEDGTHLAESNAIQWYLAEGTPFLPDDRRGCAEVLQWLFFEQYTTSHIACRFWIFHYGLLERNRHGRRAPRARLPGPGRDGDAPPVPLLRGRALHDRRHRPVRHTHTRALRAGRLSRRHLAERGAQPVAPISEG
jgi:glutathione S-transferase